MNKLLVFVLFIWLIGFSSAIKISEVEINPVGGREGIEWIELYNDGGEVDISLWEIYDGLIGPKNIFTIPSGIILSEEDYYVVELDKTVLNNDGDFVSLYNKEGEEIDKTQMIKETKAGSDTWQLCDEWKLAKPTKGLENNCWEKENIEEDSDTLTSEIIGGSGEGTQDEVVGQNNQLTNDQIGVIELTPKDIKTSDEKENSSKIKYWAYSFVLFCVLLIILYILKFKPRNDGLE